MYKKCKEKLYFSNKKKKEVKMKSDVCAITAWNLIL